MCGIAGEFSFFKPVAAANIKRMTDAIRHRGPDADDLYCEEGIGLGHRRLAIIDLSESGRNPIWTADRSMAIIFNGEVYNYREIKTELKNIGYSFSSDTDTEVVLNAIHCWGIHKAVQKFVGMFAFAVWDTRDKSLLLVRDRAGIKPLFYFIDGERILFGSELRTLYAHPAYKKNLDQRGLSQFFTLGYTLGEQTIMSGTHRVPSAHYMRITEKGIVEKRAYWSLDDTKRGSFSGSFEEAAEEFESLAENAFSYRLVSDVPVGVFLSGGIDSSLLSAILKKKIKADLLHITIGFKDARYNEAPMAEQIAKELGIRHEVRYLDAPDAVNALKNFSEIYDEPFGDASGMPTALVSKIAREYVKVALSADGGDEQFCGYESYPSYRDRFTQMNGIPQTLRSVMARGLSALPYERLISGYLSVNGKNRRNPRYISTFEKAMEIMSSGDSSDIIRIMNEKGWPARKVGSLLGYDSKNIFADTLFASRVTGNNEGELIDTMMRADYQSFMRDDVLNKVDRASMASSLECRDPFLDHRIAEFAFSLPMEYMYFNGEHKRLLKHILRRWISEPVLRAPKRGFSVPLYEWMHGPFRSLVYEYLSKERILADGVLDPDIVTAEVDRFYRFKGMGAEKLFLLLNFQMWMERWYK